MKTKLLLTALLFSNFLLSQTISTTPFASGFTNPVDIANAGDSRLFIVEQAGRIKILNANGTTNSTLFLNISTLVGCCGERGLLGLAFHPNYATNGFFYVNYTNTSGNTVIARYTVSADPNVANAASGTILLTIPQPYANHNGGTIKFGPDGFLYIGMGDGGSAGDPENRAQNINSLLGKMLRIDVNSGSPYGIPPTNPYAGATPGADEIWAIGLRNPWKFSFDAPTGNLWIADVGQDAVEEINRVNTTTAGLNFGWKCYEGSVVFANSGCPPMSALTFPIAQYSHDDGCSITGGYVYNGTTYPAFQGNYFFADYCVNRIGMVNSAGTISYSNTFSGTNSFTSFGLDVNGEIYVAGTFQDIIYKIVDSSLSTDDFSVNGFKMYPNPAKSEVTIENSNQTILKNYSIVDMSGKTIVEKPLENVHVHKIDVSSLSNGLYMVILEDQSGLKYTSKLNKI